MYALVARRHMHVYGTTQDQLGGVAVAQRRWANLNPQAQMHDQPLTLDDYRASRWIVEPFHVFDCCLVSNGGLAVIVTSAERARALRKPPVYVWGMAQGHLGGDPERHPDVGRGAREASRRSPWRASPSRDVDVVELYDCYTFTVLVTLEDYGFCPKGEGGAFAAEHHTGPGGRLALNTGGGQLSSFYMWGMTPVSEAVIQLRGEGGARQVAEARCRARVRQRRRPVDPLHARAVEAPLVSERRAPHPPRAGRSRRNGAVLGCRPPARARRRSAVSTAARSASRRARCAAAACRATRRVGRVSGRGRVFSVAVMHQANHPWFAAPRAVRRGRGRARRGRPHALDRGRASTRTAIAIGMPVEVDFEDVTPEISLPVFRPAAG